MTMQESWRRRFRGHEGAMTNLAITSQEAKAKVA
jgi:hypothetical protein